MSERMVGVVTRVMLNNGYGFIRGLDDKLPRFFNIRDVQPSSDFDTMHEGQRVTFTPTGVLNTDPSAKNNGLKAIEVMCD